MGYCTSSVCVCVCVCVCMCVCVCACMCVCMISEIKLKHIYIYIYLFILSPLWRPAPDQWQKNLEIKSTYFLHLYKRHIKDQSMRHVIETDHTSVRTLTSLSSSTPNTPARVAQEATKQWRILSARAVSVHNIRK